MRFSLHDASDHYLLGYTDKNLYEIPQDFVAQELEMKAIFGIQDEQAGGYIAFVSDNQVGMAITAMLNMGEENEA